MKKKCVERRELSWDLEQKVVRLPWVTEESMGLGLFSPIQ